MCQPLLGVFKLTNSRLLHFAFALRFSPDLSVFPSMPDSQYFKQLNCKEKKTHPHQAIEGTTMTMTPPEVRRRGRLGYVTPDELSDGLGHAPATE